jgi:hypothetical protein
MKESQKRPLDRPHRLWCRVCRQYVKDKGDSRISDTRCPSCSIRGCLVFRYRKDLHAPACGDLFCDGDCQVLECTVPTGIKKWVRPKTKSKIRKDDVFFGTLLLAMILVLGFAFYQTANNFENSMKAMRALR